MSRPTKCRKVCCIPKYKTFTNGEALQAKVVMSIEEYEAIRLIDKERLTQEEASVQMNISRTTLQRIYDDARKKLASILVDGGALVIEGGCFEICDGRHKNCHRIACIKTKNAQNGDKNVGL